jgi:hypothetical protein
MPPVSSDTVPAFSNSRRAAFAASLRRHHVDMSNPPPVPTATDAGFALAWQIVFRYSCSHTIARKETMWINAHLQQSLRSKRILELIYIVAWYDEINNCA